jgi:hypothetical protein
MRRGSQQRNLALVCWHAVQQIVRAYNRGSISDLCYRTQPAGDSHGQERERLVLDDYLCCEILGRVSDRFRRQAVDSAGAMVRTSVALLEWLCEVTSVRFGQAYTAAATTI